MRTEPHRFANACTINRFQLFAAGLLFAFIAIGVRGADGSQPANSGTVWLTPRQPSNSPGSSAMTLQAWRALEAGDHDGAIRIVDECVERFALRATKQQKALSDFAPEERAAQYGALNDVATALFIKGKALREKGLKYNARETFLQIIKDYTFAQCWDPRGWYWKVSSAARDQILSIDLGVDYGDYTSETLTTKAWNAFNGRDYGTAINYANKCIDLYEENALTMQEQLEGLPPSGKENDYWALNDVGTCLFIRGRSMLRQNRTREAIQSFKELVEEYPSAQCYNPKGYYWSVSDAAKRYIMTSSGRKQSRKKLRQPPG